MGIDIWEVIEAAKTKPFGFMPLLSRAWTGRSLHTLST
jgi:UDP-N-acetyl-D-mannosaminuronate dehydrogenase